MTVTLHCYSYPKGDDAHAIKIAVSPQDAHAFLDEDEPGLDPEQFGKWVRVREVSTGKLWDVRSAPCGSRCRCAAQARAA